MNSIPISSAFSAAYDTVFWSLLVSLHQAKTLISGEAILNPPRSKRASVDTGVHGASLPPKCIEKANSHT